MSDQLFDIIFRGDIVLGHQITAVKQRLGQLFKADEASINALFSGVALPLKRNLDAATAEKYKAVLIKAGAQVELTPAGLITPKQAGRSAVRPGRAAGKWTLAPVGADLLPVNHRAVNHEASVTEVDTRGLSIRPMEGDLLDESEKNKTLSVELGFLDFDLMDLGVDLLSGDEKLDLPEVELDTSQYQLAPLGSDMGAARKEMPPPPPDVSGLSLSEPKP